jgi:hypothetical protein
MATANDRRLEAVLDILAPKYEGTRFPIFEWPHETTPTPEEVDRLVGEIVDAIERTHPQPQTFSCAICMYSPEPHFVERDDILMVIGGMLVCVDHEPFAPGRVEFNKSLSLAQRIDPLMAKLGQVRSSAKKRNPDG